MDYLLIIFFVWIISVKPTLKKVSKYENKFAKLQKKAAEFNFRNQLKVVKKKEFTLEEEEKEVCFIFLFNLFLYFFKFSIRNICPLIFIQYFIQNDKGLDTILILTQFLSFFDSNRHTYLIWSQILKQLLTLQKFSYRFHLWH